MILDIKSCVDCMKNYSCDMIIYIYIYIYIYNHLSLHKRIEQMV